MSRKSWIAGVLMNKYLTTLLPLGLLVVSACNQEAKSKDHEQIEGMWLFVATVGNGKRIEATEKEKGKGILFKGNKFHDNSGEKASEGTFKLDATKNPKAIELTFSNKNMGYVTFAYELQGDKLRITQTLNGEYVTEFDSHKTMIQEFVREKK